MSQRTEGLNAGSRTLAAAQSGSGRFSRLEAVRGAAAIYVMLHHAVSHELVLFGVPLGFLFRFGQEAVVVFFILSGFVIKYSFDRRGDMSAAEYWIARGLRIYPILLMALGLAFLAGGGTASARTPETFLLNLLMVQDDIARFGGSVGSFAGNHPLWSLSYEWWFYVLFWLFCPSGRLSDFYKASTVVLCATVLYLFYDWQVLRFGVFFAMWWSGVELAVLYRKSRFSRIDGRAWGWLAVYVVVVMLLLTKILIYWRAQGAMPRLGYSPIVELRMLAGAALFVLIGFGWRKLGWRLFGPTLGVFAVFAPISYGLYVLHVPAIMITGDWGSPLILSMLVALAVAWIAESVIYRWIEASLRPQLLRVFTRST